MSSQWINLQALRWAYEQEELHATTKAVLLTLAIHANERGYSWPSVERIASAWCMDRETVRRQIERLLVRRMIYRTKKRFGATGQVKVFRLPKIAYESSGKFGCFEAHGSGGKLQAKRRLSGGEFTTNNENRITEKPSNDIPSNHPLWDKFAKYCKSRNGKPHPKGFQTWLKSQCFHSSQKPKNVSRLKDVISAHRPTYQECVQASIDRADRENGLKK